MEAVRKFRPNIVRFQLATGNTGKRWWYIVGCYLDPNDTLTVDCFVAALKEGPRGAELLVAGYSNVKLSEPEGDRRGEDIAAAMATEGIKDISAHFLLHQRSWCRDGRIWSMIRLGREVRSRTDYILGTYCRLFWNVSVR